MPAAKSLGVLVSTLAFRQAKARACWDALLVNRHNQITEGTRTNLFYLEALQGDFRVFTPPAADALEGITRRTLLAALVAAGIPTAERPLSLQDIHSGRYSLMLTSTSTGVVPVSSVIAADGVCHSLPSSSAFEVIRSVYLKQVEEYAKKGTPA